MVIGHQKGRDTKENLKRNFGMPHPEGYRKALRLMKLAEKFSVPVVTFIDTPGAYPGLGAEERGQSEAIARNLLEMAALPMPIVATVIGEGGSGGALALGVADRVLMLENAVYSVITPEGCAAILWKDASQRERAAEALKITRQDCSSSGSSTRSSRAGRRRARRSRRRRRSAARGADPPRHRAAEDPPREARPPPGREVRRHGRLHRGLMTRADDRGPVQGHPQGLLRLGGRASPLRTPEAVHRRGRARRDFGRVTAMGDVAAKKCAGSCTGCAWARPRPKPRPLKPVLRRATPDDIRVHDEAACDEDDGAPEGHRAGPHPWPAS